MPIQYPALYAAVYRRMQDLTSKVVTRSARGRNRVFRSGDATDAGMAGADRYRTVFESNIKDHRWTGPRPRGVTSPKPVAEGVYTSLGLNDALLGEFAFYAFGTTLDDDVKRKLQGTPTTLVSSTFPATLATKRIFEYEFSNATRIADLSLSGSDGRELLAAVELAPAVRTALQTAGYPSARAAYVFTHKDPVKRDYSLPRAMAQAVRDLLPGYMAIWVSSAQASGAVQMNDIEGDNIVFFGPDRQIVHELKPVREISFDLLPSGRTRDVINVF